MVVEIIVPNSNKQQLVSYKGVGDYSLFRSEQSLHQYGHEIKYLIQKGHVD
jgi:hypothetical protein